MNPNTPNAFEQNVQKALVWIRDNRERFWTVVGTIVFVSLLIGFVVHHRTQQNEEAWNQLGLIQGHAMQGQYAEAKKGMDEWEKKYQGSSAAGYQQFLKADLLYGTSDYAGAAQIYASIADKAPKAEMKPLALSAQASAEEMAGHLPQAAAAVQRFLKDYPDHFLAPNNYLAEARLAEMTGNSAAAAAAYDRFAGLYPQHPSVPFAKARLQALGGVPAPAKK